MWILGNARREISAFYGVAIALIATSSVWTKHSSQIFLALMITVGIDTAHVYATAWRSWFDKKEVMRARLLHIGVPLITLLTIFLWCVLGIPYLWSAVLYLTVFHHIRQFYGVHRWSFSLNRPKGPLATTELYAFTILPFVGYHFRNIEYQGFFTPEDMLRFPNQSALVVVYALLGISFASYLVKIIKQQISWPVVSTIIFPAFINLYCFLIAENFLVSLLPILAVHGVTYFHLSAHAQAKVHGSFWLNHPRVALALIITVSVLLGGVETWLTESQLDIINSEYYRGNWLMALGVAIVTTPAIYHYIADGFLWKRSHPDFTKIVGNYSNSK